MIDWDELVRREGPAVWRTIYRLVRHQADADECFQEAFLAAVEFSRRQTVANWPALLQRLATSRAIDRLRRRLGHARREEANEPKDMADAQRGPLASLEATELSESLRQAIARLPARQGEAFCLSKIEGWTYIDIGKHFSISTDAVGVLLHRARAKLQESLSAMVERQV